MIGVAREPRRETELLYSHGSFLAEEDMTFEVVEFANLPSSLVDRCPRPQR